MTWRGDQLFAGHVTRTWKGVVDNKSVNLTAYGTADDFGVAIALGK